MARLIDADKLIEKLEALADSYFSPNCSDFTMGLHDLLRQQGADAAIEVVKEQMPIDTVKHGHWRSCGHGVVKCNRCGKRFYGVYDDDSFDNYCRNCGAKMGGIL